MRPDRATSIVRAGSDIFPPSQTTTCCGSLHGDRGFGALLSEILTTVRTIGIPLSPPKDGLITMANKSGKRRGRVANIPLARELPEEERESADDAFSEQFPIYLGDEDRVNVRIGRTRKGVLVDWFIGQQVHLETGWTDVVTYDCSHEADPHRHQYRRTRKGSVRGRKEKVAKIGVLQDIFDEVYAELLDSEWQENRRRFLNG